MRGRGAANAHPTERRPVMGSQANKSRALFAFAALSVAVEVKVAYAAPGDIHSLGTLGGYYSYGAAINASGQVVGGSVMPDYVGSIHAFRYTGTPGSGGVMHDLGTLGGNSDGGGINASGQVAGTSYPAGTEGRAFRYSGTPGSGGAMADLGTLGGQSSRGLGINAGG